MTHTRSKQRASALHASRRSFLRSASGALFALPLLESFGVIAQVAAGTNSLSKGTSTEFAKNDASPKRAVFLAMGYGVTKEDWYPDKSDVGIKYKMPDMLKPLEQQRQHFTILQNLMHQHSKDGHWGSTFWLTGANPYHVPGQSFYNSISADQVIAQEFGERTRFSSIRINGCGRDGDGHGLGDCVSWNHLGKAMSTDKTSLHLYHKLFAEGDESIDQTRARLQNQKSILDAFLMDAKTVRRGLSKLDNAKLDEYFQSVREIETRLEKEKAWLNVPKKQPRRPMLKPGEDLFGRAEMDMVQDLMVAAIEVDASRVFTYQMPVQSVLTDLGAKVSAHSMSHYSPGDRKKTSQMRDLQNAKFLSSFITKLQSAKQPDGSTLLDHTVVTMGSNLSHVHNLRNSPTIVAGGDSMLRHGKHIVMPDPETPLCNLWLSIIRSMGLNVTSHGDSNGLIPELLK